MTFPIAVKSLDSAGGTQLAGGQDFFFVEDQPVVLLGDPIVPHGDGPHAGPYMAQGSSWMTLNGIPVCRESHLANCGHPSTGRTWFVLAD